MCNMAKDSPACPPPISPNMRDGKPSQLLQIYQTQMSLHQCSNCKGGKSCP